MERPCNSVVQTPVGGVVVQKRSSRSYRQSVRSSLGVLNPLSTPALKAARLSTSRKAPRSHDITEKVDPGQLSILLKAEWKLWYVTPLHRFRHAQLRTYSRQLSAFIAAEKQRGWAVEVEGSKSNFRVTFSVVQGMTETQDDAETILIQIHSQPFFTKPDEPLQSVWSGWLTCVNGNPDYLRSLSEDFTSLPLFGSKGPEALTAIVKSWFQQMFDCCFGPLEINHTSLQWLVALWTNCHSETNIRQLKMVWNVPAVPPLNITYTVDGQDAWELWSSVERERGEEVEEGYVDIKDVLRFMQGLKNHFYRHFKLDLSGGSLSEVSTAVGSAKFSGRIRISSSRYMITTLALLTECALLKMPLF